MPHFGTSSHSERGPKYGTVIRSDHDDSRRLVQYQSRAVPSSNCFRSRGCGVIALSHPINWAPQRRDETGSHMTQVGQASESSLCHWACLRLQGAFRRMAVISKTIARIPTSSQTCEDHQDSRTREVAMAKVIEFYIPQSFRRTTKWVPDVQRGKILELRPQTTKSA